MILKPTRLYLLKNNDLEAQVKGEKIKLIFKKEFIFSTPSFELRTVLKIFQKASLFAQKSFHQVAKAVI